MTTHLRVTAGGHELLLPSTAVRRITEEADTAGDVAAIDLAEVLGGEPGNVVIHYGENGSEETLLAVDEVKGLVTVPAQSLVRLPPLSPQFTLLFESISIESIDGHHPLCLRARLDLEAA